MAGRIEALSPAGRNPEVQRSLKGWRLLAVAALGLVGVCETVIVANNYIRQLQAETNPAMDVQPPLIDPLDPLGLNPRRTSLAATYDSGLTATQAEFDRLVSGYLTETQAALPTETKTATPTGTSSRTATNTETATATTTATGTATPMETPTSTPTRTSRLTPRITWTPKGPEATLVFTAAPAAPAEATIAPPTVIPVTGEPTPVWTLAPAPTSPPAPDTGGHFGLPEEAWPYIALNSYTGRFMVQTCSSYPDGQKFNGFTFVEYAERKEAVDGNGVVHDGYSYNSTKEWYWDYGPCQ